MKSKFLSILCVGAFITVLFSCSTKKDAFLNRNLHALSTKYNVLYNGQLAFDDAKKQLDDNYKDNFWEILPIEPLKIEEEEDIDLPSFGPKQQSDAEATAQGFDRAEEKAVKAIQKHSMDINGRERNRQIDDAYLLLGKARYYSQRFVPALEAFNFILGNYTDTETFNETRVWQAKTLIRLQNEELAIETLEILLKNDELPLHLVEEAHTALAMAYKAIDSTNLVIKHLDSATIFSENNSQKARNLFIIGQLYRQKQEVDSSNIAFESLINFKKAPHRYKVHALVDRAKNYTEKDSAELLIAGIDKLIKERENKSFWGELYYQKGIIELKNDSIESAVKDLKKSIKTEEVSDFQKELAYEQLGNIYFDKANFQPAGSYYDSVLQITKNENDKRVRRIKRKRESLEEVIFYETLTKTNDSILKIATLSEDEQKEYYQNYIDKLKKEEEQAKKKLEQTILNSGFGNMGNDDSKDGAKGGKFYFYNVQVSGFGKQEFKKVWGNRPLEDNWRISSKKIAPKATDKAEDLVIANSFDNSKKYDLDYYLGRIPNKSEEIDSINSLRNDGYFKLGLIYKEQFKENELAADRLEKLLSFNPKENLILPTKYHLYKIYSEFDVAKSNKYKEEVVNNYPDSRYATIIMNPEKVLLSDEEDNSPEAVYEDAFCDYDYEYYDNALSKTEKAIEQFEDLPIIPKFELLKAFILMKMQGKEAFKDALSYVSLSYPNTEEGKHAVKILESMSSPSNPDETIKSITPQTKEE